MIVSLSINTDPAIARERIYQDYIHECQMLLLEVPKLAEKLATYLIQKDQHWFPVHINVIGNSSNFKEIGMKNYWINNSVDIWNFLLGLKMEVGFTPFKMALLRLYKNSLLTKFLKRFEIEILEMNINIKHFINYSL
jgi:hypothetical protein